MKGLAKKLWLALVVLLLILGIELADKANPIIWTDKADYRPGETVIISGQGFHHSQTLVIRVTRPDGSEDEGNVVTDGDGIFTYRYQLDGIEGKYLVEAIAEGKVLATCSFTDQPWYEYRIVAESVTVCSNRSVGLTARAEYRRCGPESSIKSRRVICEPWQLYTWTEVEIKFSTCSTASCGSCIRQGYAWTDTSDGKAAYDCSGACLPESGRRTWVAEGLSGSFKDRSSCAALTVNSPPTVSGTPDRDPNSFGWYNDDVVITWSGDPGSSGVTGCDPATTVSSEGEAQVISGHCTDVAGCEGRGSVTLNIDRTPPRISGSRSPGPNTNSWNNTDVTVRFNCTDALSGIDACVGDTTLTAEGVGQSVTGITTDKAGNSASAIVSDIDIDKTAPLIMIDTPKDGAEYILNQRVIASWSVDDTLSGLLSTTGTSPDGEPIDTSSVGDHIFTVTAADLAGNTASVSHTYSVRYRIQPTGAAGTFLENPIAGGGGQVGMARLEGVYTVGEIIHLSFRLTDIDGVYVTDAHPTLSVVEVTILDGEESYRVFPREWAFEYTPDSDGYFMDFGTSDLAAGIYDLWIAFGDGARERIRVMLEGASPSPQP